MVSFFQSLMDKVFGQEPDEDELPDDGGLAEFAKQYAKQLEEEEKYGKKPGVRAEDVIHIQQGKKGARAYMLDASDFKNATVEELRLSVPPVIEGILKSRCGEKGKGYMVIKNLYAFQVNRNDPIDEYNAAIEIIDQIGTRLLGDRYVTGERRIQVPVAEITPDDLIKNDGTFDMQKAKQTMTLVRDSKTHGPANVNWETNSVEKVEGDPDWKPNQVQPKNKQSGEWSEQKSGHTKEQKSWSKLEHQKKEQEQKQWSQIEHKPKDADQGQWQAIVGPKKPAPKKTIQTTTDQPPAHAASEQAWGNLSSELHHVPLETKPKKAAEEPVKEAAAKEKPKPQTVKPASLRQLGEFSIVFRPTWDLIDQKINTYCGHVYCKLDDTILQGSDIYPQDEDDKKIHRIDKALARQAAQHMEITGHNPKRRVILPFHISSLLAPVDKGPLKPIRELSDELRQNIQIEILGLNSLTSPHHVQNAIEFHQDKFPKMGLRFDPDDLSRSLINRSGIAFISCDITEANIRSRDLEGALKRMQDMAKSFKIECYSWGVRTRPDLGIAIKSRCHLVNGSGLVKEQRKPGKIIPVPIEKLLKGTQ